MALILALYDPCVGHPVTVMGVIGLFVGLAILAFEQMKEAVFFLPAEGGFYAGESSTLAWIRWQPASHPSSG